MSDRLQVLHLEDDPAEPHYIETIAGEGYRFMAEVLGQG